MLSQQTLARPYAKGAYHTAKSAQTVMQWATALHMLAQLVRTPELRDVIKNPMIKKANVVNLLMQAANVESVDIKNFLSLLAQYHRLLLLPDIEALFMAFNYEDEKVLDAEFISPIKASEETLSLLKQRLEQRYQRKIHLSTRIDKTLIGGGIIRVGDHVIDGSLKSKLQDLSKHLLTTEGPHAA